MNATVIRRDVVDITGEINETELAIENANAQIERLKRKIEDLRDERKVLERQKKREEKRLRAYCEDVSVND